MTPRLKRTGYALLGVALAVIAADRLLPPDMTRAQALSPEVTASDGALLRPFLSKDGAWRLHTTAYDVSPRYLTLLMAYEDRRFEHHVGVDLLALGRAASQWLGAGHVVSGGSTLTMQVARLLEPARLQHRGVFTKMLQMVRAVQLEERYSKDEILSLYLTLAPMGGNLEGVRAASLSYFGKAPAALDLAESALLVALPQAPVKARPDRHAGAALAARNHVLDRMVAEAVITAADAALAKREGVPFARQPMSLAAPHLAQKLVLANRQLLIKTTIDARIQAAAERMAAEERGYFDDGADLAIVVVENKTRNLIAYVGGTRYWGRGGQVDLASRSRSPGSALKPFIYGLAFDNLALHPLTRMTDEATQFGDYAPQDFEGSFQGTVTAREALQMSLNIPAVALLDRVGPLTFTMALENAGAHLAFPPGNAAPSLPVALGGLGISLADIAMLYAGIAEGGEARALRVIANARQAPPHRLFGPVAAWYLRHILNGVALPDGWAMGQGLSHSRSIGFKTGTSYGFRDAWAVGFSNDYTVAVWVGRADGTPRPGHMGREAGAPILLKMFGLLPPDRRPAPAPPAGALLAHATEELPMALQLFRRESKAEAVAALPPPAIAFPPNGAVVPLPGAKDREQTITLRADGGRAPLTWLVNGEWIGNFDRFAAATYRPQAEGLARVTVVDADGRSDSSEIRFKKIR
ncbi:MAG: penicillin-binding protein 1C [Alphaproteobacteria bacterium]|nr:penicillin-binding protein 1C [Alphaproteobacteria bacterium]